MAKMITWIDRFQAGDYPMVCARSGLPADRFAPVEASRVSAWPWIFTPFRPEFWIARWSVGKDRLWGKLPFASGHVEGISATWDRNDGVAILRGVHPDFISACHAHQRALHSHDGQ
jgi:hypothetical protein